MLNMKYPYDVQAIASAVKEICGKDAKTEDVNAKWGAIYQIVRGQLDDRAARLAWTSIKQRVYTALKTVEVDVSKTIRDTLETAFVAALRQYAGSKLLVGPSLDDYVAEKMPKLGAFLDDVISKFSNILEE